MKLVKQSNTVWGEVPCGIEEAILWIENAGRVCYRSEDKIVKGSGRVFVDNILKRKHYSVIEHSNLVIKLKNKVTFPIRSVKIYKNIFDSRFLNHIAEHDYVYVGGNWRAWLEWSGLDNIEDVIALLGKQYSEFEILTDNEDVPHELKIITVEFNTNRAMTHELVRHRPASYSQESQRYVRYGKIKFIKPVWYDDVAGNVQVAFNQSCKEVQDNYKWLLNHVSPQQARNVLTNAVATKIITSATTGEWDHIFNLRCSGGADPQMIDLMIPVQKEFKERRFNGV